MQTELVVAVFAGLGGMVGWGLADFFAKKTIDIIGDFASLAWGHVFGLFSFILFGGYLFLIEKTALTFPTDIYNWIFVLIFGFFQAIVYIWVYQGFGKGQVSLLSPVFASFSGITALLSIVFFQERVSQGTLLALGVIFVGIILLNLDPQALRSRKLPFSKLPGFTEVILATLLAAFWTLYWDQFMGGKEWFVYTFIMYASMTSVIWMFTLSQKKVSLKVRDATLWKYLFCIGFFEVVAYLAITLGYSATTKTSIIAVLSGAFSLPTILLARVFLKERTTQLQLLASLVIVVGIVLIAAL